jgi:hypothetical protein
MKLLSIDFCLCYPTIDMSILTPPLRKRGPPATGKGLLVGVRLQPVQLNALDTWIASQPKKISRPEAVRQLLASALKAKAPV